MYHNPYRSNKAQNLHTFILRYIYNKGTLAQFASQIREMSTEQLRETSANGHTHLYDIIHLTHEIDKNNPRLYQKAKDLFDSLMAGIQDQNLKRYLLTTSNEQGFTPMSAFSVLDKNLGNGFQGVE
jgi:hypothetical protein